MSAIQPARLRRMSGRDPGESHRTATGLELLFDLTFVIAFGFAADGLTHAVEAQHAVAGVLGFAFAMFAIVWAWINFSWFASAFDTDDWVYRLTTMVQMVGVLVLALGIPPMFDSLEKGGGLDNRVIVGGYVVMRLAMVSQWLRAAKQAPAYAPTCRAYAVAIVVAQVGWVGLLIADTTLPVTLVLGAVLWIVELAGPAVAERRTPTPWHAHHIAERFMLLTIIALGEGIIGSAAALSAVVDADGWGIEVAAVGLATVGITVAMWWGYTVLPSAAVIERFRDRKAFVWGYAHLVVFGAIAAVGAGLHVSAAAFEEHVTATEGEAAVHAVSPVVAVLATAIPLAIYLASVFLLHEWLVGEPDAFHLMLFGLTAVLVVVPVALALAHVPMWVCLLVLTAAPVATIVGWERVGHRHQADALRRLLA